MSARLLISLLLAASASCSGAADPTDLTNRGSEELRAGDYESAVKSFDLALQALAQDTSHPMWHRAKMGAIEGRAHTDPTRAVAEFLEYASAPKTKASDKDFNQIGGRLGEAGNLDQAVVILTEGIKAYPESPHLTSLLNRLGDMAKTSGSAATLDKLKGLGYVGGE